MCSRQILDRMEDEFESHDFIFEMMRHFPRSIPSPSTNAGGRRTPSRPFTRRSAASCRR